MEKMTEEPERNKRNKGPAPPPPQPSPPSSQQQQVLNLDSVLIEEIGQFGLFQITVIMITALSVIFSAMAASEYIFSTGRLPTRCLIPECDGETPEWQPEWLGNAVPGSPGNYDECSRFANTSLPAGELPPNTCPAELFDRDSVVGCERYVHERTNTVVYDFGLECDEWRRTLIGSIRTVGLLISLPLTGLASDRWGRRIVFSVSVFAAAVVGLLRAFVNNYESFIFLQVIESGFGASFSTAMVLVTEFVGPKFRVIAGPTLSCFVAVGFSTTGFMAWGIQPWRTLTLAMFIPQLVSIGFYWVMPESVRWLMGNGKFTKAEKTLNKIARMNKKTLSPKSVQILREAAINHENNKEFQDTKSKSKEPSLFLQVIRSRQILHRCCVTPIWWISAIMVYYGVSVNAVSLAGNQYLNYVYVSLIEIPGYITAMLILDRIGRKVTLFVAYLVCSACQFGFAFWGENYLTVRLILYLLGKYCISLVVTSLYVYTAELYPTNCRHTLLAFSSMVGRIGGIIAPLTPALMMYWEGIPSVMFGSLTLLSAILILTTPETLGTKLPDTIHQAEIVGGKGSKVDENDDDVKNSNANMNV